MKFYLISESSDMELRCWFVVKKKIWFIANFFLITVILNSILLLPFALSDQVVKEEQNKDSIFDFFLNEKVSEQKEEKAATGESQNDKAFETNVWSNLDDNSLLDDDQDTNVRFMDGAIIMITDINSGRKVNVNIEVGKTMHYDSLTMQLTSCVKEEAIKYRTESKALIAIYESADPKLSDSAEQSELFFYGWLFSKHRSFAMPIRDKYFFSVSDCYQISK